jgi:hypothetical protein
MLHDSAQGLRLYSLGQMGARAAAGVGDRDKEIFGKPREIHLHQESRS